YQSSIEDAAERKKTAAELNLDFLDQLNDYNNSLNDKNVDEQLKKLQKANEFINYQVANEDAHDNMQGIATDTRLLKQQLDKALQTVENAHDDLKQELGEDGNVNREIRERLGNIIGDAFKEN